MTLAMAIKIPFSTVLRTESNEVPWLRMVLCGLAAGLPLLVGVARGQPVLAIYGSLCGYLLALNDHLGALLHRLGVISLTFVLLIAGFAAGVALQADAMAYAIFLSALVYWLGLLGGEGAELERSALYATIGVVIAHSSPLLPVAALPLLFFYSAVGYAALMAGIPSLYFLRRHRLEPYATLGPSLRKSLTWRADKHIHAASYAFIAMVSIGLATHLQIERGYWVTVTVLLIMQPDRTQSLYKTLQRLFGTVAAVLLATLTVDAVNSVAAFALLSTACAFAVPWAGKRNYWMVSFFVTVMVVCLLEIASPRHSDTHLPLVRLQATLLGCALSVLGSGVSKLLDVVMGRGRRER